MGCRVLNATLRFQVPNSWVLRVLVIVVKIQVLGIYMIFWVGPFGLCPRK